MSGDGRLEGEARRPKNESPNTGLRFSGGVESEPRSDRAKGSWSEVQSPTARGRKVVEASSKQDAWNSNDKGRNWQREADEQSDEQSKFTGKLIKMLDVRRRTIPMGSTTPEKQK